MVLTQGYNQDGRKVRWTQMYRDLRASTTQLHWTWIQAYQFINDERRWSMSKVKSRETKIQHIIYNANWRKRVTCVLSQLHLIHGWKWGMVFDIWASITTPQAEIPCISARLRDYAGKENHDLFCNMLCTERETMSSHNSAQLDLDSSNQYWIP